MNQNAAGFEERADQLTIAAIQKTMADAGIFRTARQKLLAPGAKLLIGPRGTGKTHVMRYTYAEALTSRNAPVVLYANFNRYLTLEPLLAQSVDAIKKFQVWMLAKLLIAAHAWATDTNTVNVSFPVATEKLSSLVALLERGAGDQLYNEYADKITIDATLRAIDDLARTAGRERTVLLLDDAALTLADRYLEEFFRIFRILKTETISPKASVYPGTTQYGPTFHAAHEVEPIALWVNPADMSEFSKVMSDIEDRRMTAETKEELPAEIRDLLKLMSFGVPRAYLRMIREYSESKSATTQSRFNQVVSRHRELLMLEYESLKLKLPQFSSVIEVGSRFFDAAVFAFKKHSTEIDEPGTRQITLGVQRTTTPIPLWDRMIKFLVEVGLLYPLKPVSHGSDRKYDRFIPHFAIMQEVGVFRTGRGWSAKDELSLLHRPDAKHPVRREPQSLLGPQQLELLRLNLPPCSRCATPRLKDDQIYCHQCGTQLIKVSQFESCMDIPLSDVPGVSETLLSRIKSDTTFRTIRDIYASQNPAGELQEAHYVGPKRARTIVEHVRVVIDEFLS